MEKDKVLFTLSDAYGWPAPSERCLLPGQASAYKRAKPTSPRIMGQINPTTAAQDLDLLRAAAASAGIIACGYFRQKVEVWSKGNASPVTEADMRVDRYLRDALMAARPEYGWLSEESADTPERLKRKRVFIIDPIDGTRGFIRGDDSWTVSLAVAEDGVPIAGVVYAPARDEMYDAIAGGGARLNSQPLQRQRLPGPGPLIPAPGAVHQELQAAGLHYRRGPAYASIAYSLVQVAQGRLDAAVSRRGSQDWDIAAAAIILREAGMHFADVCAGFPRFNRQELRHGALAALCDEALRQPIHEALIRVYGCPGSASLAQELERRTP